MSTPEHYRSRNISHWSPSKINKPFWYVIAEYGYRQQKLWQAQLAQRNGDAHADIMVAHYAKPPLPFKPLAGTVVADAATAILNGEHQSEMVSNAIGALQEYNPDACKDHDIADFNLAGDGEHVIAAIENTLEALREAFPGANQVECEEKVLIELLGVNVPVLGYSDARGGGVVAEIKTKWDSRDRRSSTGFKVNSVPARPLAYDVLQLAVYQKQHGGRAKLIYANRKNYRVFEVPQDQLDEAISIAQATCMQRQKLLERTETVEELLSLTEPDWSHWLLSDWSPELVMELKDVWAGN